MGVARALASAVRAMALMVLAGWMLDVEVMKSLLHPGRIAMNPLTALAFILSAAAVFAYTAVDGSRARGRMLGAAVMLIGALRVIAYQTTFDAGIDRVLFPASLGGNVMAPNTAFAFFCVGLALVLMDTRPRGLRVVAQFATLVAGWISLLSLTGYLYNIRPLYGVSGYIPMALNTSLAFALLCTAVLVARPRREPLATIVAPGAGGHTARRLLPAAILVPLLLGLFWLEAERMQLVELEYGLSIFALANVLALSVLIWLSARSIARVDQQRVRAAEQLREATIAAEEANRAKSDFLANMSHEIRTPMNGVLGMLELMQGAGISGQQREYLGIAQQSAEALLRLLNDILDFSKIEAGKLELEAITFELRDLLADTLQAQAFVASMKDLELAYQIPPDVPDNLIGDPGRLRQVLFNLVGNAIKFTDQGEIVVSVRALERHDNSVVLDVAVRDTGIGIAPENVSMLFEPFSQIDASMTRRHGGSGLGLAISTQLVAMMGGELGVESTPGGGSTFRFTARFGVGPSTQPRTQLHREAVRGLEVLVVDDNATNRFIVSEMLSSWEMSPHALESGAAALAYLETHPLPRLVLLDAMMPEMDGFTLADRIGERFGDAAPTLLMLSSAGHNADCEKHGIARCLTKPVKQSDLFDAIAEALDGADRSVTVAPSEHDTARTTAARRVLLVEDGLVNQAVAANLLRRRGHEVVIANNGREALDLVEADRFDVVLMDVQMPVMDGFEATARIRERERASGEHIPIVAMTAHAMRGDRERCLEAGMDDYLAKPVDVRALYAAVERTEHDGAVERPPDEADWIDEGDLLARFGGDRKLLSEVSQVFALSTHEWMRDMRAARDAGDAGALAVAAHAIKGAVANFTRNGPYLTVSGIERSAREGGDADAGTIDRLESELSRLVTLVGEHMNTLRSP